MFKIDEVMKQVCANFSSLQLLREGAFRYLHLGARTAALLYTRVTAINTLKVDHPALIVSRRTRLMVIPGRAHNKTSGA